MIGGVATGLGVQIEENIEHLRTGWGVQSSVRLLINRNNENGIQFGAFGGRGISHDIYGLQTNTASAASVHNNALNLRPAYGFYAGQLFPDVATNIGYGYARADGLSSVPSRATQNTSANLIYQVDDQFSLGLVYAWGQNKLGSVSGENHRLLLVLTLSPNIKSDTSGTLKRLRDSNGDLCDKLLNDLQKELQKRENAPRRSNFRRL